ncbi:CHASE2 domain-containing protein [Microcoleus sp. CAWBG58]|uniref:CHASE2 domain-containing protein n=1 Tax=Microcoleus sp. CAWBG58 TaxID=2841651 RepID=UPI0025D4EABD|nr:CHASE2 domain-containing protein [Microcoleus sp. CAWBG58]
MGRIAVLKIGQGSFEQGFEVLLRISTDDGRLLTEIEGNLLPNPGIEGFYISWQTLFRRLKMPDRQYNQSQRGFDDDWEIDDTLPTNRATSDDVEVCRHLVRDLESRMKKWLQPSADENWQKIRERLAAELANSSDEIRLVIQARNPLLWKLPWHVWDLLELYDIGIGCVLPEYTATSLENSHLKVDKQVRILAVFGDDSNINLQPDRDAINDLPGTDSLFLQQPNSQDFIRTLRQKQGWEIFFFAGHSQTESATGRIYISDKESLRLDEFKNGLKEAIANGLKVGIFNSCDGLGLAQELVGLRIPVAVVMQEAVPDEVAQAFLKEFLSEYAAGKSLYAAVWQAQKRLEDFQHLPGATWLPMIFQNLTDVPPSWQLLQGTNSGLSEVSAQKFTANANRSLSNAIIARRGSIKTVFVALSVSLIAAFAIIIIRDMGVIEPFQLKVFDSLMRTRPMEPPDPRILIIEVTPKDVNAQIRPPDEGKSKSLYDSYLARILDKLATLEPRAIGLDIYRDYKIQGKYKSLIDRLRQDDKLITICQVGENASNTGRSPSPDVLQNSQRSDRVGFSDIVVDRDGVIRRHLLSLTPPNDLKISPCQSHLSFSFLVALRYLHDDGITASETSDERPQFKINNVVLQRLKPNAGSYHNIDAAGSQLLLNYRSSGNNIARKISLLEFLNNPVDRNLVKDKIVLIGTSDEAYGDFHSTPYGKMSGVVLQAHKISQILSAVGGKTQRPLLKGWPQWQEDIWILTWALAGGLLAWQFRALIAIVLSFPMLGILYYCSYTLLIRGWWVPLLSPSLALILAAGVTVLTYKIQKYRIAKLLSSEVQNE